MTRSEIANLQAGQPKPKLNQLPTGVNDLKQYLAAAAAKGELVTDDQQLTKLTSLFNDLVKSAPAAVNTHILFGFSHGVNGQTEAFNKILAATGGYTHLGLEINWQSAKGENIQRSFDRYTQSGYFGDRPALVFDPLSDAATVKENELELREQEETLEIANKACAQIVATDPAAVDEAKALKQSGWNNTMAARGLFAAQRMAQRLAPQSKNVVVWRVGASHVEKHQLPYYLKMIDPHANVISIVMNGGTMVETLGYDKALEQMGRLGEYSILKLADHRDADYIVHLPTNGQKQSWGNEFTGQWAAQILFNQ
jgi:hypothetical protein